MASELIYTSTLIERCFCAHFFIFASNAGETIGEFTE